MYRVLAAVAALVVCVGHAHGQAGGFFFPGYGNTYGLYSYGPGYNYGVNGSMVYGPSYNSLYNLRSGPAAFPRGNVQIMNYPPSAPIPTPLPPLAPVNERATIQVVAPAPDAEIMLGNSKTTSTGIRRVFFTDPLEPGYQYSYAVTVTWRKDGQPHTETRNVDAAPGRTTVVDFTRQN